VVLRTRILLRQINHRSTHAPAISNALCFDLDVTLDALCQTGGVNYTRYADDLFFRPMCQASSQ
jgi:hypothetical protein